MTKIVFDANVIISAGLKPRSAPARAILLARSHDVIVLSNAVETEIRAIIARPKFRRHTSDLLQILDSIAALGERHEPTVSVTDCRDAKDNKYLELAMVERAADKRRQNPFLRLPMGTSFEM